MRENGGGETVHRVVGFGDYIILILELEYDNDRTEDLLFCDLSVGRNTGGGEEKKSVLAQHLVQRQQTYSVKIVGSMK